MTLSNYSSLAIIGSFLLYLTAAVGHAGEWAKLRGVPIRDAASDDGLDRDRIQADTLGRFGIIATGLGVALHLAGVVLRGVAAHRMPWGNMYEFVISALLFAAIAYLIGVWRFGLRWLGVPANLLFAVGNGLAVTVFYVDVAPLVPALHSVWFVIHIVAACISAAAFNIGGLASILYLVKRSAILKAQRRAKTSDEQSATEQEATSSVAPDGLTGGSVALATRTRTAPEPVLTGFLARVPSLAAIDQLAYRVHAFAFPIWTFTIAAGAIWAEYAWGRFWGWDPKETWALITWIIYAGYLHARSTAGFRGRNAAIIAIVGLASFWFNFVGVNLLAHGLHSYAGI